MEEELLPLSKALDFKCQRRSILSRKVPPHNPHEPREQERWIPGLPSPHDLSESLAKPFSSLSQFQDSGCCVVWQAQGGGGCRSLRGFNLNRHVTLWKLRHTNVRNWLLCWWLISSHTCVVPRLEPSGKCKSKNMNISDGNSTKGSLLRQVRSKNNDVPL